MPIPLNSLTIDELQREIRSGNKDAIFALGLKVSELNFCYSDNEYCRHRVELHALQLELDNEIPEYCPHCEEFLE